MNQMSKIKITCIGDSLTEGDYGVFGKSGIANVNEKNYPYYLKKLTNAEVVNCGKCGYTSTSYLDYYKSGSVHVADSDFVIVMLGTNGGLDDAQDTQGNKDYEELINLIKSDAPKAKIIVCTPPHATSDERMSNCGYAPQAEKAVKFVKSFSERNNIPCIDLSSCALFTAANEPVMQPNDGLHYTEVGYGVMAAYVYDFLKNNFSEIFR